MTEREIRDLAIKALEDQIKEIVSTFNYSALSRQGATTKENIVEACNAINAIEAKIKVLLK